MKFFTLILYCFICLQVGCKKFKSSASQVADNEAPTETGSQAEEEVELTETERLGFEALDNIQKVLSVEGTTADDIQKDVEFAPIKGEWIAKASWAAPGSICSRRIGKVFYVALAGIPKANEPGKLETWVFREGRNRIIPKSSGSLRQSRIYASEDGQKQDGSEKFDQIICGPGRTHAIDYFMVGGHESPFPGRAEFPRETINFVLDNVYPSTIGRSDAGNTDEEYIRNHDWEAGAGALEFIASNKASAAAKQSIRDLDTLVALTPFLGAADDIREGVKQNDIALVTEGIAWGVLDIATFGLSATGAKLSRGILFGATGVATWKLCSDIYAGRPWGGTAFKIGIFLFMRRMLRANVGSEIERVAVSRGKITPEAVEKAYKVVGVAKTADTASLSRAWRERFKALSKTAGEGNKAALAELKELQTSYQLLLLARTAR